MLENILAMIKAIMKEIRASIERLGLVFKCSSEDILGHSLLFSANVNGYNVFKAFCSK